MKNILKEIRLNKAAGINSISLHSDDFLRYGSTGLKPNPEAVLDLFKAVKRISGRHGFGTDFVSIATVLQDVKLVEQVSEVLGLGNGKYSTIETGIETASSRLLNNYMPGKVKPYDIQKWPELVVQGGGILHDNNWIVCYSIIIGLPGETKTDLMKTWELVDELKKFNGIIVPIVFIPAGGFRKSKDHLEKDMTAEQWALFFDCIDRTLSWARVFMSRSKSPLTRLLSNTLVRLACNFAVHKSRKLKHSLLMKGNS